MDFYPNTTPETDNDNQNNINNTPNGDNQYNLPNNPPEDGTTQNINNVSGQEQEQTSYDYSAQSPYQVQHPYGNNSQSQYQVQQPYGNDGRYPYQNGNQYANNNGYNYNNTGYNPNYGRYAYPVNVSEPGSKLATAAMILGIISIISCFTFTVYPAFITGSIAIVLALLSKGRRPKFLSNARIGIICAIIGLVSNVLLITGTVVRYYTDDYFREQVNQTWEDLYGQTLDEMIEEMLEESGYTD